MTRKILFLFICSVFAVNLYSDVSVGSDVTVYSSYGLADEDQMVTSTQTGVYEETKNGHIVEGKIKLKGSVENRFDLYINLKTKSATGSPYIPLSIGSASASDYSISLSDLYGQFRISDLLFKSDINILMMLGKFGKSSSDFAFSGFGLDSVTGVTNLSNAVNVNLQTQYEFGDIKQLVNGQKANITLDVAAGAEFGEDVQRLYDVDGGISEHGKIVVGEYAPQLFVNLALNNYVLPKGMFSFGVGYAMNSNGFYTGNAISASTLYKSTLVENKLVLPVSLSFAMTDKNIDVFTGSTDNSIDVDTTAFRNTLQVAGSVGIQKLRKGFGTIGEPMKDAVLTISGSFNQIDHLYRDSINIINLGLDGKYYINPKIYVGGGAVLGTLTDVTWQTSADVSSSKDDFNHTFTLMENYGYEAYAGLDFLGGANLILGFSQKKGLAMNYGLESTNAGMVKYKQAGTEMADNLWETMGIFLKATISL